MATKKPSTRGGRRNEAAAANGKTVGRPRRFDGGKQFKVTIDRPTLGALKTIDDNLSIAIQTVVKERNQTP